MGSVIQEVNLFDLISFANKKNKKMQAVLLQKAEEFISKDTPEYLEFRKIVLDETSGTLRAILREILGDVEMLV